MAVLGRLKIAPNQRLDLPDIQAFDSYSSGDWMNFMQGLTGGNPYILQGFDVIDPATLINNPATQVNINLSDASMWWPAGGEGSFFVAQPGATADGVSLITSATNYIEATFSLTSGAQDARALWDPSANGGAGGEFTQVVDTEYILEVTISVNNTGFDADAVSLASVVVNSSNVVTAITDCRPMLFRLGSGGANPDPSHSFIWPNVPLGYAQTDTPGTMTSPSSPNPFQGADKNITALKQWMDAVMSRIKDLDGGDKWFIGSGGSSGSGGQLSLSELFLDSEAGHSPIPNRNVRVAWSQANDSNFRSIDAPATNEAIAWKANIGQLTWQLGGSFVSSNNRAFATYTFNIAVPVGDNLYLHLQRDAILNGDPAVTFQNINGTTGSVSSAATGSFVGIAVGDFVRKLSGSVYQYYQVLSIAVNNVTPFTNGTIFGTVADGTVQYVTIATHDGPILASTESYRYFRTQYSTADLSVSQYGVFDTSYYWLGANSAGMFYLRYYGDMQPGEEAEWNRESSQFDAGGAGEGSGALEIIQSFNAAYDHTGGYYIKGGATTAIVTLIRQLADNTVGNPSNVDNSGSTLTYTINAPLPTMNDGDGLWVRLSNTAGGVLTAGSVTTPGTDNTYAQLPESGNPLKVYNNLNVFLLARKHTASNGIQYLFFQDGTVLNEFGQLINTSMEVAGDMLILGDLTVEGHSFSAQTGIIQSDDKIIDLGIGTINMASGGSGIRVADNTLQTTVATPSLGAPGTGYINLTVPTHGYSNVAGQTLAVSSNVAVGGIAQGEITNDYLTVAFPGAATAGQMQVVDANTLRIFPIDTVTSATPVTMSPPTTQIRVADLLSWIKMTDSSGSITGMTSWDFRVKGLTQDVTLTPHTGYGIVPTANSAGLGNQMVRQRIPYVAADGAGPSGYDTTFDFSSNLTWDGTNLNINGNIIPETDNTWTIGSTAFRWASGHFGPGSVVVHNDNTNTEWLKMLFSGSFAQLATDTTGTFLQLLQGSSIIFHAFGTQNIFAGGGAGNLTMSGTGNSALGFDSLVGLTSGSRNIGIGPSALIAATTGSDNIAIGSGALQANITNSQNVAIGTNALHTSTANVQATAVGYHALQANTTGVVGTAFGNNALGANTTGNFNTAVGFNAMQTNTGGAQNTGMGASVLQSVNGGNDNSGFGFSAMGSLSTGNSNTGIGYDVLNSLGTGSFNTAIGAATGFSITTGSNNTIIGAQVSGLAAGLTSNIILANGTGTIMAQHDATNWNLTGSLIPTTTNVYDLGTSALRWRTVFIGGAFNLQYGSTKTSNYTILTSDCVIPFDTTGGSFTLTLPTSTSVNLGQMIILKDVGGQEVFAGKQLLLAPNGTDTIDGVNATITVNFSTVQAITLIANGAGGWIVV